MTNPSLENLLREDRTFPPPEAFRANALASDEAVYDEADEDPEAWWAACGAPALDAALGHVLEWDPPHAKWFSGGQLNVSDNCLDRHIDDGHGEQVAYHWEGEPGDTRTVTYAELRDEVCRFANALKGLGVAKGDRVMIYLPMIPELPVAMLACARIGAIHSVVFAGFSSKALIDRIEDADAQVVITADGAYRKGNIVPLKDTADQAMDAEPTASRPASSCAAPARRSPCDEGRDHWYHDLVADAVRRTARPSRWTPRTCSTSSTRPARPGSPRASCTPRAATSRRSPPPTGWCSTSSRRPTCTGAPPTSAGSPGTATSCTDRWRTARPR